MYLALCYKQYVGWISLGSGAPKLNSTNLAEFDLEWDPSLGEA